MFWNGSRLREVVAHGGFTVKKRRKMTGIALDGPTFFAELLTFCDVAISHN